MTPGEPFSPVRGAPSGMTGTTGSSNYPYVTARISSLKTFLLGPEEYPKLIARDVHEIARRLEEGRYKEQINDLASSYSGAQLIERATQEQMGDEFRRILSWCQGEPKRLLGAYFDRFIVSNIKTLLRGTQGGSSSEEIRKALIPAGLLKPGAWDAALAAEDIEACREALPSTRYTRIVEEHEDDPLPVIENALDRAYYEGLVREIDPSHRSHEALLRFIQHEIDIVNLKLLLRTKHAEVPSVDIVPSGSRIKEEQATRLQAARWEELPDILDDVSFGDALRPALDAYLETRDLNTLTTAVEHLLIEEADEFGTRYPLSILPLIEYVLRKKIEVDRIRMIAFGKQSGLSRDDIKELIHL